MNVKIPALRLTVEQKKILDEEVRKQYLEAISRYDIDYEAAVMWVLHSCYGFGIKRLLKFREDFIKETKYMRDRFQTGDAYAQRYKLKEIGYDVEKLNREDDINESN